VQNFQDTLLMRACHVLNYRSLVTVKRPHLVPKVRDHRDFRPIAVAYTKAARRQSFAERQVLILRNAVVYRLDSALVTAFRFFFVFSQFFSLKNSKGSPQLKSPQNFLNEGKTPRIRTLLAIGLYIQKERENFLSAGNIHPAEMTDFSICERRRKNLSLLFQKVS
jgi:hypothetical protein